VRRVATCPRVRAASFGRLPRAALVEDAPGDQGVSMRDPTAPGRLRTLHAAHRPGHHAVAATGPAADLGETVALAELADAFALGLGDVQGVGGGGPRD
jgi:hypothetical protein